ncbi:ankyrin repeat domain-containing protein [Corallococcus exiguus]|uniref:ankyrin repeat domain-containing protein n=1 Tax=Corallococcus exiguus TaxID=83462 RepID=UPI001472525D|nr:ankyrin repeat domain-containing protein [Corallococcus exiguus]NNC17813.1 ankyrin repeat domain-containing protein [Corallococcus exiguus]
MAAARVGRADLVRVLLEAGADPALPDNLGEAPFVTAAAYGHVEMCALLFSKAPDEKGLARTQLKNQGLTELEPPRQARRVERGRPVPVGQRVPCARERGSGNKLRNWRPPCQ